MERTALSRNANSPKVKMAAAAILICEQLLQFLHYLTYSHQTWWDVATSMLNANVQSEMNTRIKYVVYIKYRPAGRNTANPNVKDYISLKRGV